MATKEAGTLTRRKADAEDADALNPKLNEVYERVCILLDEVDKHNVVARWSLGREIDTVMTDERTYEPHAAVKLADRLNIDVQELYRFRNFSTKYTKQQIQALLKRKTENGRSITWSHLDHLVRVPSDAGRDKLTEAVFSKNLNVRELAAEIQKKYGNRSNNPKGKGKVGPRTPGAALALMGKHASSDSDAFSIVNKHMQSVIGAPAQFATDEFLADLTEAKTQTNVIASAAAEVLETIANAEAAVAKSLRFKKNQALADRSSEKATTRAAAAKTLSKKAAPKKKILVLPKKKLVLPPVKKKTA